MIVSTQLDSNEGLITVARGADRLVIDFAEAGQLVDELSALIVAHDLPRRLSRDHRVRHGGLYGRPMR